MMCALLRQLLAAILLTAAIRAGTLEEAGALYRAGDFSRAAATCESLISSDGATASRLYNLGNARVQLKEYGPAILAYERALLLAPRDADIRANLKIARDAASANDGAPLESWWEYPLRWLSLHEWSWFTVIGAVVVACAALAWGIFGIRRTGVKRVIIALLACGLVAAVLGGFAVWHRRGEAALGIVIAAKPVLRLSPFATADSIGECGPGRTVELGERVPGWVHVKLRGSETTGWLREEETGALMR
jgi:tetratricopeptide (TPR) repeat protein